MNALRSSSALARRSLATPPAPLSSTSRLISSSSFTSSSSKRSISSTSLSQRTNRVAASSRWSGSIPSSLTQTRTMASETKIKVKTPVVELDGDEVWDNSSFYSSKFQSACFTSPYILVLGLRVFVENAGKHGGYHDNTCVNRMMTPPQGFQTHFGHMLTELVFANIDDSYYLARNQRKGKLIVHSSTALDLRDPHHCRAHAVDTSLRAGSDLCLVLIGCL